MRDAHPVLAPTMFSSVEKLLCLHAHIMQAWLGFSEWQAVLFCYTSSNILAALDRCSHSFFVGMQLLPYLKWTDSRPEGRLTLKPLRWRGKVYHTHRIVARACIWRASTLFHVLSVAAQQARCSIELAADSVPSNFRVSDSRSLIECSRYNLGRQVRQRGHT